MTKKNGGQVPAISDKRVLVVPVGCGKCMECRKQKAREWQVRLLEDVRHHKNGKFITLTFSNESIAKLASGIKGLEGYELDNEIATIAMRRFLERWRKKYKKSIRHWFITELGHNGTENIHMHGIIWTNIDLEEVKRIWKYGYVWTGKGDEKENYVNEKTVNYITKYVHKQDEKNEFYKAKILTSAGIGREYTTRQDAQRNKYNDKETNETYTTKTGHKIAMPTYWRNKIYTEDEREKLWLQKLDKQERWVGGERVCIKNGDETYYKTLKYYRQKSKRLGYGDDTIDWNKKNYENERRKLKIEERIRNSKA